VLTITPTQLLKKQTKNNKENLSFILDITDNESKKKIKQNTQDTL